MFRSTPAPPRKETTLVLARGRSPPSNFVETTTPVAPLYLREFDGSRLSARRGGAAAATWTVPRRFDLSVSVTFFRGGASWRRRGRDVDSP